MGIFEIFSPRPNAFGERDEQTLQALAYRIVRHTKQSGGQITGFVTKPEDVPTSAPVVLAPRPEPQSQFAPEPERPRTPVYELKPRAAAKAEPSDHWTATLAICAGVIACLIVGLMGWRLFGNRSTAEKPAAVQAEPQPQVQELDLSPVNSGSVSAAEAATPPASAPVGQTRSATASDVVISAASRSASDKTPPTPQSGNKTTAAPNPNNEDLAVYDANGKLIYGKPVQTDLPDAPVKKVPGKPRAAAPSTSGLTSASTKTSVSAASSVKSAAMLSKSPETPLPLIDGQFVRLKPELAESLLDQRIEPDYPESARRAHVQGSVVLETLIGANGRVQQVSPVSGPPQLADAAVTAVRQWRYKPFTVDGKKVPIRTQVTVTFMQAQ